MSRQFFEISRGIELNGAQWINGTGAPGVSGGDADLVGVGSVYQDLSNGNSYVKIADGAGANKWLIQATEQYVQSMVTGASWREPADLKIDTAYADLAAVVTALNADNSVQGFSVVTGSRLLLTNVTGSNANVFIVGGTPGSFTLTEDPNGPTTSDAMFVNAGSSAGLQFNYGSAGWVQTNQTNLDELGSVRAFIGKDAQGVVAGVPDYSSNNFVTNGDSLKAAIGKIDAELGLNVANGVHILATNKVNANISALDTAVGAIETSLASTSTNLQTEIDAIESAVGLSTSGAFNTFTTTNYMNSATSIVSSLVALDSREKTTVDALAAEVARATAAEALLAPQATTYTKTEVDTKFSDLVNGAPGILDTLGEIATALQNDEAGAAALATALATETTNRTNADAALQAELDATQLAAGINPNGTFNTISGSNYLDASTSLRGSDLLLDTQIKLANDAIAALSAGSSGSLGDLQAEVDRIETAAGLNADGTYTANATANYIAAVTSLKGADNALDAAIKSANDALAAEVTRATDAETALSTSITTEATTRASADATETAARIAGDAATAATAADQLATETAARIAGDLANSNGAAAIQAELDATQAGAGLNTTGAYIPVTGSNYIDASTTLASAIALLDSALHTEELTRISQDADLAASLAIEVTNRTNADTALQASITTINSTLVDLAAADTAETAARIAADNTLTTNLASEVTRATTAEAALAASIAALGSAFNYVGTLSGGAPGTPFDLDTLPASGKNTGDYYKVIVAGEFGFNSVVLTANVGDGIVFNTTGGFDIIDNTNSQVSGTVDFITVTGTSDVGFVVDVATTFKGRVTTLETGLTTEITNRTAADAALQAQIDALDSGSSTGLAALQAELDATQASVGVNPDGTFATITGTNYLNSATSVLGAAGLIDAQLKINADAIVTEAAARSTADATFTTNLGNEVTRATAAEASLQAELDATQAGAGLEANGTYATPTGSNYLNSATSLKDADYKLDAALKGVSDTVAALSSSSSADLAAEIAARIAGDNANATATATVATNLATEIVDRANAVSAEAAARAAADALLAPQATTYTKTEVDTKFSDLVNGAPGILDTLGEIAAALQADETGAAALAAALATETTNRINGDTTLTTNLAAEVTRATAAETALQAEIDAIEAAVGLNTNGTLAAYTSHNVISDTDTIALAVSKLDSSLASSVAPSIVNNVTTLTTVDSVSVDSVEVALWLVTVQQVGTNKKVAQEVYALHNGTASADATTADSTVYAKLKTGTGSISGLSIGVALTGSGTSQVMALQVSASTAVDVKAVRLKA